MHVLHALTYTYTGYKNKRPPFLYAYQTDAHKAMQCLNQENCSRELITIIHKEF
eukprot:c27722_g1_i1 orf=161-322(+)